MREHEIWDKVSNLDKLQAIKLGLNLSIQKNRIDVILDKEKEPGIGALVLVLEWKSDLEQSGDSQCSIFNNALEEAKQNPYIEDDWRIIHDHKISREQGIHRNIIEYHKILLFFHLCLHHSSFSE